MRAEPTRLLLVIPVVVCGVAAEARAVLPQDQCGPFTDVSPALCPYVFQIFSAGITAGTSPTTFSPDDPLSRGQASVFVTKTIDRVLARSSRRAALGQWWTTWPHYDAGLGVTIVGTGPRSTTCDGADVWVVNEGDSTVSRVRGSDGKLLENWTVPNARQAIVAMGRVFVTAEPSPTQLALYVIDPTQPPGLASLVGVGDQNAGAPAALAFDGLRIWVATKTLLLLGFIPSDLPSWAFQTVTLPESGQATALLSDGTNLWVAAETASGHAAYRVDWSGSQFQRVALLGAPQSLFFDGVNIWVLTSAEDTLTAIRASTGEVISGISGGGMDHPNLAIFDGERILVTNSNGIVILFNAFDLSGIGYSYLNAIPRGGGCSDGLNFWFTLDNSPGRLARF